MNDKEIEDIQTVDITVTAESLDAHIECLKENGYTVNKSTTNFRRQLRPFSSIRCNS